MRKIETAQYRSKLRKSNFDINTLYLPKEFIDAKKLESKKKYPIRIEGLDSPPAKGTLQDTNAIGGMATMYKGFQLAVDDEIGLDFEDGTLIVIPPEGKRNAAAANADPAPPGDHAAQDAQQVQPAAPPPPAPPSSVFEKKKLRYLHIPEFAPANLTGWTPETETDVYLVFGMLAEYTTYRYCCGFSADLQKRLGYIAKTKPDAVLIERATGEYRMAEVKVYSSDFASNHDKEDVDVLICWIDDEVDKGKLPPSVLALKDLREKAVKEGDIELDDFS